MRLSKDLIKTLNPPDGLLRWYEDNGSSNVLATIVLMELHKPEWSSWLITRLMSKEQSTQLMVYVAKDAVDLFEQYNVKDTRPREALEAAQKVLTDDTVENRKEASIKSIACHKASVEYSMQKKSMELIAYTDFLYAVASFTYNHTEAELDLLSLYYQHIPINRLNFLKEADRILSIGT